MKDLYLQRFVGIGNRVTEVIHLAKEAQGPLGDQDKAEVARLLGKIKQDCVYADLVCTQLQVERLLQQLDGEVLHSEIAAGMPDLLRRLNDEAGLSFCLILSRDEAKLYSQKQPFGPEVEEAFPSAISDIVEASRCLSLARGTASVFHLMRVMEAGLKGLAKALGIPYAPSWESYLKQIHTKVDQKYKKKGIKWRRDEPFFTDTAAHLQAVRVAWRNPTMHIVSHYSPESAEEIFNAVRGFMASLSKRLNESGIMKP